MALIGLVLKVLTTIAKVTTNVIAMITAIVGTITIMILNLDHLVTLVFRRISGTQSISVKREL